MLLQQFVCCACYLVLGPSGVHDDCCAFEQAQCYPNIVTHTVKRTASILLKSPQTTAAYIKILKKCCNLKFALLV
jgi:hypothetical protein